MVCPIIARRRALALGRRRAVAGAGSRSRRARAPGWSRSGSAGAPGLSSIMPTLHLESRRPRAPRHPGVESTAGPDRRIGGRRAHHRRARLGAGGRRAASGDALGRVVRQDHRRDRRSRRRARAARRARSAPGFPDRAEVSGFYEGYANATLWPLLHYLSDRARFDESWASTYFAVNRKFAEAILEVAEDGDLVWIHDYHLFPWLPQLLRGADRKLARSASSSTRRSRAATSCASCPERDAVLTGLLGADLIGFHTYNYLRHFRSALLRVLGHRVGDRVGLARRSFGATAASIRSVTTTEGFARGDETRRSSARCSLEHAADARAAASSSSASNGSTTRRGCRRSSTAIRRFLVRTTADAPRRSPSSSSPCPRGRESRNTTS